ncbi:GH32 C-terminal domain-containing protein [Corynebacterium sp. Marseille-P4321]|uniref:GH32 C-terminal domain-containing protein n=1 Tax=Corynebacterium sp. Marseille-P4321 TaxID=2736603 RepID=UPI00158DBAC1|nr:GH32 C-terminal domain-containing protein [Corynebacterium sp. Marseille-P4321]
MTVYRPELHVTAERGILEGPAGVFRSGGPEARVWHMFYQYRPAPGEASRWGHEMSEDDPFSFLDCNDVIVPVGGETNIRAGAVTESNDGNGVDLYFSSETAAGNTVQIAHVDNIDELCDFDDEEFEGAPNQSELPATRLGAVVEDTDAAANFRSPCVVPGWEEVDDRGQGHSGCLMLAVTGPVEAPVPVVLSSEDGRDWRLLGPLTFEGDTGYDLDTSLVAPRIIRLRDEVNGDVRDVLFITLERDGKDTAVYAVGELRGNVFSLEGPFRILDHGHDFTRPRNTNYRTSESDAETRYERAYLYGFMTNTDRAGDPTEEPNWEAEGWANALTLPRRVTLQGGRLYQVPAPGLPDAVDTTDRARLWTALCDIPSGSNVTVEVLDGTGEAAAVITHDGDTLTLDRMDGSPATAELHDADEDNITVIVDGSTIEVYAGGGSVVMSSRIWPESNCAGIRARATDGAEIQSEWRRGYPGR